jgi:hypothetical protein
MEMISMAEQPESFGKEITQEVLDDFTNHPEKYSILEFQEIELARNTKILFDQFFKNILMTERDLFIINLNKTIR